MGQHRRGSSLTWQRLNSVSFIHVKSTVVTAWRTVFILSPVVETDLHIWTKICKEKQTKKTTKKFQLKFRLIILYLQDNLCEKFKINERKQSKNWESYKKKVDILFPKFVFIFCLLISCD